MHIFGLFALYEVSNQSVQNIDGEYECAQPLAALLSDELAPHRPVRSREASRPQFGLSYAFLTIAAGVSHALIDRTDHLDFRIQLSNQQCHFKQRLAIKQPLSLNISLPPTPTHSNRSPVWPHLLAKKLFTAWLKRSSISCTNSFARSSL